jgi:signal transduction histidine kinase
LPKRAITDWSTYRKAYDLLSTKPDSAFFYFNAITTESHDSLQIAMAYSIMGQIQYRAGDFFGSQESLLNSLKHLRENDRRHYSYLASNYNDLGLVRSELKDTKGAIDFYQKSLKFDRDSNLLSQTWNNMAFEWQRTRQYGKAISLYQKLLGRFKSKKNIDYARAITNLATTQWMADRHFNAAKDLREGLAIRIAAQDLWGENSSFAHLSDYYRTDQPDSAFAQSMYNVAKAINSPDDQMEALGRLIDLAPSKKTKYFFDTFKKLNDSLQTSRNAAKNQFALIRYQSEKHKADNLRLTQENTRKENEIIRQRLYLAIGVILLISTTIWFWSRRQRLLLEADNRIRQDRLQIMQRVHDVVANGIYRVMNEVDYSDNLDKSYVVNQLDEMYEQSRKISQDENVDVQEDFSDKLQRLANAFKSSEIKFAFSGNEPQLWDQVSHKIKRQLEIVVQELLVNMAKHSHASQAIIDFELVLDELVIKYRDNGVGFPADVRKGKGLQNTENRINAIGGHIIFEEHEQQGARLRIATPIH